MLLVKLFVPDNLIVALFKFNIESEIFFIWLNLRPFIDISTFCISNTLFAPSIFSNVISSIATYVLLLIVIRGLVITLSLFFVNDTL